MWPFWNKSGPSLRPVYDTFVTNPALVCDLSVNHLRPISDSSRVSYVIYLRPICDLFVTLSVIRIRPIHDSYVTYLWPIGDRHETHLRQICDPSICSHIVTHMWPICDPSQICKFNRKDWLRTLIFYNPSIAYLWRSNRWVNLKKLTKLYSKV